MEKQTAVVTKLYTYGEWIAITRKLLARNLQAMPQGSVFIPLATYLIRMESFSNSLKQTQEYTVYSTLTALESLQSYAGGALERCMTG